MAGYVFQLDRAFSYLASAGPREKIAIEYIDDVSVHVENQTAALVQEQNKNSIQPKATVLGDRSHALWHTLEIWLNQIKENPTGICSRYVLATNKPVSSPLASLIKLQPRTASRLVDLVASMRVTGKAPKGQKTKIQATIDTVLSFSDAELTKLLSRVEVTDSVPVIDLDQLANGFGIPSAFDTETVLNSLRGWMITSLRMSWGAGLPGMIGRASAITQCRQIESHMARQRLMPRPASEVPVTAPDRVSAQSRPFVDHLQRISAGDEDIYEAIDHFVQFNLEKHRLALTGEIPDSEWHERSRRLTDRWTRIMRAHKRNHAGKSREEIGTGVLEETTYHHREPLFNSECNELYMTSGHYHRLADDSDIWWDPEFNSSR
jgi:hypothetical protein